MKNAIKSGAISGATWFCIWAVVEGLGITTNAHIALIGFIGGVVAITLIYESDLNTAPPKD